MNKIKRIFFIDNNQQLDIKLFQHLIFQSCLESLHNSDGKLYQVYVACVESQLSNRQQSLPSVPCISQQSLHNIQLTTNDLLWVVYPNRDSINLLKQINHSSQAKVIGFYYEFLSLAKANLSIEDFALQDAIIFPDQQSLHLSENLIARYRYHHPQVKLPYIQTLPFIYPDSLYKKKLKLCGYFENNEEVFISRLVNNFKQNHPLLANIEYVSFYNLSYDQVQAHFKDSIVYVSLGFRSVDALEWLAQSSGNFVIKNFAQKYDPYLNTTFIGQDYQQFLELILVNYAINLAENPNYIHPQVMKQYLNQQDLRNPKFIIDNLLQTISSIEHSDGK